jgi:two-component system nitrogen regulation response regulator NtrX
MTPHDVIGPDDLPPEVLSGVSPKTAAPAPTEVETATTKLPSSPGTLREFKEVAERAFLVGKLRENGWNISKTAETLDTPRSNLYKKLEQYGITQESDG